MYSMNYDVYLATVVETTEEKHTNRGSRPIVLLCNIRNTHGC